MSAEARSGSGSVSSSHALAWGVVALVALPLVYLLSVPPLLSCSLRSDVLPMNWVEWYGKPYDWLFEHTPLQGPLLRYADWWLDSKPLIQIGYKSPPPPSPSPASAP